MGHVLPTAHDMGREYRALTALQGSAVPVPRTVALCDDTTVIGARFYVMDKLEGITLRTAQDTARLTEQQRENLSRNAIQVLADLHRIDPAQVGLADWGRPDGYLERQLSRWMRQWQSSVTRNAHRSRNCTGDCPMRCRRVTIPESCTATSRSTT